MRHAPAMRLGLAAVATMGLLATVGGARAEYFCSPGFDLLGGRCVATTSRSEVDLYLNDPVYESAPRPLHHLHHHRRHGLRTRY